MGIFNQDTNRKLDELVGSYPSPDVARSSPEFHKAALPIASEFFSKTDMESLAAGFVRELPISELEEQANRKKQSGMRMSVEDLGILGHAQTNLGKLGLRLRETYPQLYSEFLAVMPELGAASRKLIAYRDRQQRRGL